MADYHRDFIFCSSLLPVQSLDAVLAVPGNAVAAYRDPAESPEMALIRKRDRERLERWLMRLDAPLARVAQLLMLGENQASIARKLELSEAAISKRIKRIRDLGGRELADLADSPLLN